MARKFGEIVRPAKPKFFSFITFTWILLIKRFIASNEDHF